MFAIGLDLGQAADYTALAVVECIEVITPTQLRASGTERHRDVGRPERLPLDTSKIEWYGHVRHLERFPMGTSYPAIVERVKTLTQKPELKDDYCLVPDATGVGRPVVDLLHQADLVLRPVMITAGSEQHYEGGYFYVPKRELVSRLQVALQAGRLKFAEGMPEVPTLVRELLKFQIMVTANTNDTYGAWREGVHDHMVLALALAV